MNGIRNIRQYMEFWYSIVCHIKQSISNSIPRFIKFIKIITVIFQKITFPFLIIWSNLIRMSLNSFISVIVLFLSSDILFCNFFSANGNISINEKITPIAKEISINTVYFFSYRTLLLYFFTVFFNQSQFEPSYY